MADNKRIDGDLVVRQTRRRERVAVYPLAEDFEARVREDRALTHKQRLGTSAVLAIRPWNLSMFEALRREP